MNPRELLEKLTNVLGVNALGREFGWNPGGIARAKAGGSISPFRAAQLAQQHGDDQIVAVLAALEELSRTEAEQKTWRALKIERENEIERREIAAPTQQELRELVSSQLGPGYEFVVAPALKRAYIAGSSAEPRSLARRAKLLFDQYPDLFSTGTNLPIDTRRQLMCDYLAGKEDEVLDMLERFRNLKPEKTD